MGNVGATRADAGHKIRALGERSQPGAQELGLAIARILQDRELRLRLEACTMRIGDRTISAVEMLSQNASPAPDSRSLIGAVTCVLADRMRMVSLMGFSSGSGASRRTAADVLQEYALNPNNWETGSRGADAPIRQAPELQGCAGWGLCIGHC